MDQVSTVREKIDLVALIQEYLPLKKAGRNCKTNCPFHSDKTPSFIVSPERQIWHCFSCGKGGDCFSFLMAYEHMEFPEALRFLAEKAGVQLISQRIDTGLSSKKEKIYVLNHLAAEFYHYLLTKHPLGKLALSYVLGRGIKPQTIETYALGYSPQGRSLLTYLHKKKKYTLEDIYDAGLATRRDNGARDFFQGRLMFPLFDHRGNIIGFSGRVLDPLAKTSKYINTRETLVYHKGLTFFGLNSAKESICKEEVALLMEGEFDVISSFQEGITNAVAVKGTAVTQDQVNLLARFCKKVKLCFDMDAAGQEALKRSLPLLEKKGLLTTVVIVPQGKDADESIHEDSIRFKKAVKHDIGVYDYMLENMKRTYVVDTAEGKKQIGAHMLPLLSEISNEIVKEHYLQLLSKLIRTPVDVLLRMMEKQQKTRVTPSATLLSNLPTLSREEKLEEYLVALFVQSPFAARQSETLAEFLGEYVWHIPALGKVMQHVEQYISSHPQELPQESIKSMPEELLPRFDVCFLLPLPVFATEEDFANELRKTIKELHVLFLRKQLNTVSSAMAQEKEDSVALPSLQSTFTLLTEKLRTLS